MAGYDTFGWYGYGNSEAHLREELSIVSEPGRGRVGMTFEEIDAWMEEQHEAASHLQGVRRPSGDTDRVVPGVRGDDPVGESGDTDAVPSVVSPVVGTAEDAKARA